jgi:uncharacterized membrane protein
VSTAEGLAGSGAAPAPSRVGVRRRLAAEWHWIRDREAPICLALVLAGAVGFAILFGTLGVLNHRGFGTWAYDMAIYDQAIWLVSRGGQTFMTVRGLDVWGHHFNPLIYLFVPLYWLGAGPEVLYVVQNAVIGAGALPVYLIAKHRFGRPVVGLLFAAVFLAYTPVQFVAWVNFHPEALAITPFLFAWWCAQTRRWRWFFVCLVLALFTREDVALAVVMLGVVLAVTKRRGPTARHDLKIAAATAALGAAWYLVATQLVIPHFNDGSQAFYLENFFGDYGGTFPGIARTILRHPDWVVRDAVQHDRIVFYKKLLWPLGWAPLASPLHLLMALPQMLASVIGGQVYARRIEYQYTAIMIAPFMIAAIEGVHNVVRWTRRWPHPRRRKAMLATWLVGCAWITNVAWSPSPVGALYSVWAQDNPRAAAMRSAVAIVPDDATVTSSYDIGPHLSHREGSYDWPNPFWPAYWAKWTPTTVDCTRFPSASVVDYLVLDMNLYPEGDPQREFIESLIAPGGEFTVVRWRQDIDDNVLVARRVEPGPNGEAAPPNCPGTNPFTTDAAASVATDGAAG